MGIANSKLPKEQAGEVDAAWVRVRADGIVHVKAKPVECFDVASARAVNRLIRRLTGDSGPLPVLYELRRQMSTTPAARRYGVSQDAADVTAKLAILTHSPLGAMIANTFMRVMRPPYPMRMFTAEEPAVEWLLEN